MLAATLLLTHTDEGKFSSLTGVHELIIRTSLLDARLNPIKDPATGLLHP